MVLQFRDVSVTYSGGCQALSHLTLALKAGAAVALVGGNGSGKSTALRAAAGLLKPSAGTISMGTACRRIGYAPERFPQNLRFTPLEYLRYMAGIAGLGKAAGAGKAALLLHEFGLDGKEADRIDSLSKGQRQKLCLAQALLPDPDLLIADEPLSGLDVTARDAATAALLERKRQGTAVLFSTHDLSLAEGLADIVIELAGGVVIGGGETRSAGPGRDPCELAVLGVTMPAAHFTLSVPPEQVTAVVGMLTAAGAVRVDRQGHHATPGYAATPGFGPSEGEGVQHHHDS